MGWVMLDSVRIIAGKFRSRNLEAPPGVATRPTSDRLRETLFNVLAPRMEGAWFLDLYAGSGAVGLEAISRGAAHVDLVEEAAGALKVLRGNFAKLGVKTGYAVHEAKVAAALRRLSQRAARQYDVVFLDPPYDAQTEYESTLAMLGGAGANLLAAGAVVIAEHRKKDKSAERLGGLERYRLLEQGDAGLSFYRNPMKISG